MLLAEAANAMGLGDSVWRILSNYWMDSGFYQFHWSNGVMILIGCLFVYLAVKKGFEPLLLIPIGMGVIIGNIPYNTMSLSVGVYDGPVSEHDIKYYAMEIDTVKLPGVDKLMTRDEALAYMAEPQRGWLDNTDWNYQTMMSLMKRARRVNFKPESLHLITSRPQAMELLDEGRAIMVNVHGVMDIGQTQGPALIEFRQGRMAFIPPATPPDQAVQHHAEGGPRPPITAADPRFREQLPDADQGKYAELWSVERQDTWNAGVMWMLFRGIEWGVFPPLIFLGIGALTDFGPLLSQPRTILLGAAAQLGIFGALIVALFLGFTPMEASGIGIIGGADGPTAIFVCTKLAPHLLGAVALSAYSYMAMVPIIQPPIMRLLTTKSERMIRMEPPKDVSRTVKIIFPVIGFILTAFLAGGALPLLGMLFFGNLLRESLVTERLAKTAGSTFIDIVTILLGVSVGAKTNASTFLTKETIYIFVLGVVAFSVSTAGGLLFGKIMCYMSGRRINPLIGSAGVSAVPMAARVVQKVAHEEDPHNFLLMHAMGPNVAGVIGSAVAAGVLLSYFAK